MLGFTYTLTIIGQSLYMSAVRAITLLQMLNHTSEIMVGQLFQPVLKNRIS